MSVVLKVAATKDHALKVPNGDDQIAMLHSALEDSIYISWEVNNTYQAYFTAWDDESVAYQMLTVQNMVEIDGQWFVIKQCEPDYSGGIGTTAVTLQHISGEISRMHIYGSDPVDWGQYSHTGNSNVSLDVPNNTDTVAQSVSPSDILNAFFGGDNGKNWNITYQVIGSFNNAMVENPYAAGSGKDAISRILEAWTSAVFWPDNLNLRIYSHDEFYKDYGHRYDYLRDTSEVQLQYDTTDMTNAARLVGATQEIQTTTDSKEQYYFAPFYFVDEASHQRWGLFVGDDITSDTITDKEQMKAYAESQFKANPDFTLQLTVDPGKEIIEGDMVRLEIRPADYVTKVGLVGYQKYPYSHTQSSTATLNSNAANILDFQRSQQTNLSRLQEQTKSLIISSNNRDDSNNAWNETEVKAFDDSKRS
ncbi:phage tail protein [Limosilactobacillus mucosae]|uniref:prophage endopeptidase tail family protein n=1 Tax=Limosilactobacillus mucosae TaxID=97478 RepID=UPI0015D52AD7|nr:prophage endopeptidase tail family protein [Limosilactobacillus mucosae]QLI94578.1 phage tail protein [Limosilactobacillus mucosae]